MAATVAWKPSATSIQLHQMVQDAEPPSRLSRNGLDPGRVKFCRRKSAVHSQAEPVAFFYRVISGVVCTTRITRDGRRVVRDFHLPGEFFGVEAGQSHTCSAHAVSDVYYTRFDRKDLEGPAAEHDGATRQLLAWLLVENARTTKRLLLLGRRRAVEQLAFFLVDLADRYPVVARVHLPMTRTEIGEYLGLSSETVSRAFTRLRKKGLVSVTSHSVIFHDLAALRVLGGD